MICTLILIYFLRIILLLPFTVSPPFLLYNRKYRVSLLEVTTSQASFQASMSCCKRIILNKRTKSLWTSQLGSGQGEKGTGPWNRSECMDFTLEMVSLEQIPQGLVLPWFFPIYLKHWVELYLQSFALYTLKDNSHIETWMVPTSRWMVKKLAE